MKRFDVPLGVVRGVIALGAVAACVSAYRSGGGADAPPPPPRAGVTKEPPAAQGAGARGKDAAQVKYRLNEMLADARIEAPNLGASKNFMGGIWRRMMGPWTHPAGDAGQMAMAVALRASKQEIQWSVSVGSGKAWTPDARVWNMNEGSFDQREGIFAPAPATVAFTLQVPENARLDFSPALLSEAMGTTVFAVTAVDATGREIDLGSTRIQPGDARRWFDASVDLAPLAGQTVELRLKTFVDKPAPSERKFAPGAEGAPSASGAAADPGAAPAPQRHRKRHGKAPPPGGDKGPRAQGDDGQNKPPPTTPHGMALAVWGNPTILAKAPSRVPYNVLWIVVDALRPDVIASFHDDDDDAKKASARWPPLDAQLPKVPGLMPSMDALAGDSVRFLHAYSAASWTRPGTIAMLTGARSSEVGIDTYNWLIKPEQSKRFYDSDPPLLSLLLRRNGVVTRAFVNNFFMTGYAAVGLDFGFERMLDHRYRTRDTDEITTSTIDWLEKNKASRFFLFVNYNSPHDPYDPPPEMLKRVPPAPLGPKEAQVRKYMAEGAKDDAAIGVLMQELDKLALKDDTIVVVTADHGETLSQAHGGNSALDTETPVRFHHAIGLFEETTRVPILMRLPKVLDGGKAVAPRVRTTDIAPTVLDLEGIEPSPKMSGKSLLPLVRGDEKDDRVVVSEGRNMRAIISGNWRYLAREKEAQIVNGYSTGIMKEELFDLDADPGERHSVAKERQDVAADLRAKLDGIESHAPADTPGAAESADQPTLHLRFAGAGAAHAVAGTIVIGDGKTLVPTSVVAEAIGAPKDAVEVDGATVTLALRTSPDALVGIDLRMEPAALPVAWKLTLDGQSWPDGAVFTGPFGLAASSAKLGLLSDEARFEVYSPTLPEIDPARDLGLFVTRDRRGESTANVAVGSGESNAEMNRLMQQWGYAHGSH